MRGSLSFYLLLLTAALASHLAVAQPVRDSSFSLRISLAGGYSYYLAEVPIATSTERGGFSFSARIMWHPDHLLRVGVESGYNSFYSYHIGRVSTQFGETSADLRLSAIPTPK